MREAIATAVAASYLLCAGAAEARKTHLDDKLFSQYRMDGSGYLAQDVCGDLVSERGCFFSPILGYFEHACAVLDGEPRTKGDVITRAIYILDKRTSPHDPPLLYVLERQDTITDSDDQIKISLTKTIEMPFKGGEKARCFSAAGPAVAFFGTDNGPGVAAVDKATLAVATVQGGKTASITADDRGYVMIGTDALYQVFSPAGVAIFGGGGPNESAINTRNAWDPKE